MNKQMCLKASSVANLLAILVLILCDGAVQVKSQNQLQKCLGNCGENVISCAEKCLLLEHDDNPLLCISSCGVDDFKCMGGCAGIDIPLPPGVAPSQAPQLQSKASLG